MTADSIDQFVRTDDEFSQKIVSISAKFNALEDCMGAVKKGFEKDAIDLPEYLKTIRSLAMKQAKQYNKMMKINQYMESSNQGQQNGY